MEKEELDRIRAQSDEVIRGVFELQEQIKKYKSGAESFEIAVGMLNQIAERERGVTEKIEKYISGISKSEVKKVFEELQKIEEKTAKISVQYERIQKELDSKVREEKRIESEMKLLREELMATRKKVGQKEEKRGIRKLFGKR